MNNWDKSSQILTLISPQKSRHRFSKEEDERLIKIIKNYDKKKVIDWAEVAEAMPNRTSRQCRERYLNYLNEKTKKGNWTKEEDDIIIKLYEILGPKWSKMVQYLNNRSNIDIKNHFSSIVRNKKKIQFPKIVQKIRINKYEKILDPYTNQSVFVNDANILAQYDNHLESNNCNKEIMISNNSLSIKSILNDQSFTHFY